MEFLRQHHIKLVALVLAFVIGVVVTPMVMAATCTSCASPNCCFNGICVQNGHCVPGAPGCAAWDHLGCRNGQIYCGPCQL